MPLLPSSPLPPMWRRAWSRLRRRVHGPAPTWYHPDYRWPSTTIEAARGVQPRRADFVVWALSEIGALRRSDLRTPVRVGYDALARVHGRAWLESLASPETLARIFAIEPWDMPVDAVLHAIRLAAGGTLAAAQDAVKRQGPSFNLLGGFHHAGHDRGGGFCPVNDIAVAVADLRAHGWTGSVGVLDLDAHPPDGTAECLPDAWIGSISVSDWGGSPGVFETVLPKGAGGPRWLAALDALLGSRPPADLWFVLAGADVLEGDPLGDLGVSVADAAVGHARVARALRGQAAVWLPAGGYLPHGWQVLANAWLAVHLNGEVVPPQLDPMTAHFSAVFPLLHSADDEPFDLADLGLAPGAPTRLLGFYSAEAIEQGLEAYGILPHLRRLGYLAFRVKFEQSDTGERFVLTGETPEKPDVPLVLVEAVLDRTTIQGRPFLFVNWLSLRHPRASFGTGRPPLPGQEVPGLGMAREAGEVLAHMARRLHLDGVALRPAWLHVAYACRSRFSFVEPAIQADFLALLRDLGHLNLRTLTQHVAAGEIRKDGVPWAWVPGEMVYRLDHVAAEGVEAAAARFSVEPAKTPPQTPTTAP